MQTIIKSSFRDPSSYVYEEDGKIFRKISPGYEKVIRQLVGSGLCSELTEKKILLPFTWWVDSAIQPDIVPFISYPYEWSFSMLRDAALQTLRTQLIALSHGMQLKDASAYNVQFIRSHPVLIDHSSFYPYEEGKPWIAYGQFCRHFLAPLALAAYRDSDHIRRLQVDLDGLKLGSASHLLPFRASIKPGLNIHLKWHGMDHRVVQPLAPNTRKMSKVALTSFLRNLLHTVEGLSWEPTYGWKDYVEICNYDGEAVHKKAFLVEEYLRRVRSEVVADLGCNVGLYSQVAADVGCRVIAVDNDPACIDLVYKSNNGDNILPLVIDITNPSPAIGWENEERDSFIDRLKVDTVMCLALVHHLAIGNNLPLDRIASFLSRICKNLIIEWIPKGDSQVHRMLKYREDIFPNYQQESFEGVFREHFSLIDIKPIEGTARSLYLMEKL